jgi:hypothetical protein
LSMVAKDTARPTVVLGQNITNVLKGARSIRMDGSERIDTNAASTSSFFYDPPTLGLKSTQQLNVDWSKFQNHAFFSSAEVNVNVAFDQIINSYPFDGTRKEYEAFFERLTGFEKYVLDRFPKNTGYLLFSGSTTSSLDGTYIVVNDYAGGTAPELSKNRSGSPVLDPVLGSFSVEFQLLPASQSNDVQVVCQKLSGSTQGFSLSLLSSSSPSTCQLQFAVVSGSSYLAATSSMTKGVFNHVVATYNRTQGQNVLQLYVNEELKVETPSSVGFGQLGFRSSPFVVGSGSLLQLGSTAYLPTSTLSGALDELRVFHSVRTPSQVAKYARKSIFPTPETRLYFRFNEPTGSLDGTQSTTGINSIVLDSSGNSLHSNVTNFHFALRSTGSVVSPMTLERASLSPVLFPAFTDVVALNVDLLTSATAYDQVNPNIITKLVPTHYFLEGQASDGLGTQNGTLGDQFGGTGQPGTGKLGTTQLLLSFLYVWAKFFDELKLFVDAFSSIKYVGYDPYKSAPDHFLPLVMKQYGFQIPSMFLDSTIEQFIDGEDIQPIASNDAFSLQYVQNQITRRVLANINEIVKSKGTQHSVRAFLRTVGIDPDNTFRIREFGGPTKQQLLHARETKLEPGLLLDFARGGVAISPFLSASRVEPGFPGIAGAFVTQPGFPRGVSNNPNDGLLTSGSWTYEGIYRWPLTRGVTSFTQSLARMVVTGSEGQGLIWNVVAMTSSIAGDQDPSVRMYARPTVGSDQSRAPVLFLQVDNVDIFDGGRWNVSFGQERNDQLASSISSSFFLRVASQDFGVVKQSFVTSSFFLAQGTSPATSCSLYTTSSFSTSGPYLLLGNRSVDTGSQFLNDTNTPDEARASLCNGQVSRVRFWSKALTETEWLEHVKNYRSTGVQDPLTNFNFETLKSGSWERLRIDASMDQDTRTTDAAGNITLTDFSQNRLHFQGSGFVTSSQVINVTMWPYSFISPAFDEASTNDKVRVRGFQNSNLVNGISYAQVAPVYYINPNESPTDDTRFAIEFSLMEP